MMKKKLKLSISGDSKKTISSIEKARSKSKNTVLIEKKSGKSNLTKPFVRNNQQNNRPINQTKSNRKTNFLKKDTTSLSDFEKRKLAEQRATRRIKGETNQRDFKGKNQQNTNKTKRRELKLTVSRALNEEDIGVRSRSLASLRRAKQKENRELNQEKNNEPLKPISREVNIPEVITIRELANRMAEQSSSIIKHLLGMGVTATINHTIDSDTAEYLVKEFGHTPIKRKKQKK